MHKSTPMGATWLSNLSDFQVQAIEGLNVALQDDEAVGTVYRTRFCLSQLGVRPMVKRRMLHKLILACRGSDLAFLYFLLEACYKAAGFEYSERIIMSAITYLDLEMTIRELDRILPPGVEQISRRSTTIARKFIFSQPSSLTVPQQPSKPKPVRSPYFMPLPKPKVRLANNLSSRPPRHVVTFPFWPAGERPSYNVNEESRWFANYKFQPVRRMLLGMLDEIMTEYWTQVGASKVDGEALLCEFHKEARRQEQLVKDAALVKAHQLCLSLVDTTTRHDEALKKRIVAQLDKDIENCTLRWQRLRQRHLTDVTLLEDHDQMCAMGKVPTATESNKVKYLFHEEDIAKLNSSPTMGVHVVTGQNTISQLSTVRVSDPSDEAPCPIEPNEEKPARCPPKLFGQKKPKRRVSMTPKPAEAERPTKCKKPSNQGRFFEGPREIGPFVFHYHEIPPKEQNLAPRDVIWRQIIRSLRKSAGSFPSSEDVYNARIQPREQVVAAIVQCAEGMWFGSLEAHQRSQYSDLEQPDPKPSCEEKTALEWTKEIERFDPDNLEQMKRLLRDAFAILRQDPRCVFACFPNAHESTVVLEWIKRRYGKTYSHKEINRVVRQSLPLFFKLEHKLKIVPKVETKGISNRKYTYAQHASAVKLANEIKADYSEPISKKILSVVRDCLKAMDPHLLTSSSMLKSFYAYLPVRYADMMR
ncbi:uncharacterized protein ssp5 [Drosophila kikkawai]|uniref:Uncharacterized protein ssp5 n=1 Tax=Drosophila kikkawai TaxID=30033 RepID=A0A6P4JQB1_DROKI|nr:uncharacterized protein LOC108085595 [Drosophila kikkawai]